MNDDHDHSNSTHFAKCDEEGCDYIAETHAHTDMEAVDDLSYDLAEHNKLQHGKETDPEAIKTAVRGKMTGI